MPKKALDKAEHKRFSRPLYYINPDVKILTRKPVVAKEEERDNPRGRSAKLRVVEKDIMTVAPDSLLYFFRLGDVVLYIEKQNELTELRLAIPVLDKEVKALSEENRRLKYENRTV